MIYVSGSRDSFWEAYFGLDWLGVRHILLLSTKGANIAKFTKNV